MSAEKRIRFVIRRGVGYRSTPQGDLEHFAYVASHDLQEPLRNVANCMQLLEKKAGPTLNELSRQYIAYATEGALRMKALLDGLLTYSRVSTRGGAFVPIDCGELLDATLHNLKATLEETQAIVTHETLPQVLGDPVQIGHVFQRLIVNAVKFRRGCPAEDTCDRGAGRRQVGNFRQR